MNLIEKVVIKDGVNADTTVIINQYTGQVAEINAKIAHPFIPNTRGVAGYSIVGGKPTFSFAAVGDNESWWYVGGLVIKCGGVTTVEVDQSIKVLDYTVSETYTLTTGDINKIIVVNNSSNVSLIEVYALDAGKSILIQNDRNVAISCVKLFGAVEKFIDINPFESIYLYVQDNILKYHAYIKRVNQNRNLVKITTSSTSHSFSEVTFENNYDDVTILVKNQDAPFTIAITEWLTVGRELKIINDSEEAATITLPSGHTPWATSLYPIPAGSFLTLFMVESGKWSFYKSY